MKNDKPLSYKGVSKIVESISHRPTVHFTQNARVENTKDGNKWDNPKYIIIEPLQGHEKQFVNLNISDGYTLGSVKLSTKAIIMIREDCLDEIPVEELEKYNVVIYRGDPTKCLNKFLTKRNIPIFETYPNYTAHSTSFESNFEDALDARDTMINYIKNNTIFPSEDNFQFGANELCEMYAIYKTRHYGFYIQQEGQLAQFCKEKEIPIEFMEFVLNSGFVIGNDDKITVKEFYALYEQIKCIRENKELPIETLENAQKLFKLYEKQKNDNKKLYEKQKNDNKKNIPLDQEAMDQIIKGIIFADYYDQKKGDIHEIEVYPDGRIGDTINLTTLEEVQVGIMRKNVSIGEAIDSICEITAKYLMQNGYNASKIKEIIDNIRKNYDDRLQKSKIAPKEKTFNEIKDMSIEELYKFENINEGRIFERILNEIKSTVGINKKNDMEEDYFLELTKRPTTFDIDIQRPGAKSEDLKQISPNTTAQETIIQVLDSAYKILEKKGYSKEEIDKMLEKYNGLTTTALGETILAQIDDRAKDSRIGDVQKMNGEVRRIFEELSKNKDDDKKII